MKRNVTAAVVALFVLGGTSHTFSQGLIHVLHPASARSLSNARGREVVERYAKFPLHFEPNQGQTDSQVQFLSRGNGYALFLTRTESVLTLRSSDAVVRMKLLGANTAARATGLDEQTGKSNYFIGNDPAKWRTNVPNYTKVRFESVFPCVDLVYYGNQRLLEYDFIVAPGGDPRLIRLGVDANERMQIDSAGDLIVNTHAGEVRWHKPVLYQDIAGVRRSVDGRYVQTAARTLGFDVGSYDRRYPLVIDPVLVYSTYLGGNNSGETGVGIAVDATGAAYVTGSTGST
ncbi:MAG TPA: hypothetical protein VFS57_04250, partial [Gemmatimonadaceae bacterium]|nr:hypothetical protein [Gemmatimonadaceae bacterium]